MEKLSSNTISVAATTGITEALKADPSRIAIIFSNLDTVNAVIGDTRDITTTFGIKLQSSGGFVSLNTKDAGPLPKRRWFITSSGTPTVYITEIRIASKDKQDNPTEA